MQCFKDFNPLAQTSADVQKNSGTFGRSWPNAVQATHCKVYERAGGGGGEGRNNNHPEAREERLWPNTAQRNERLTFGSTSSNVYTILQRLGQTSPNVYKLLNRWPNIA